MKLSLFPGVSLDIFNNKHFSQIFISHSEEEIRVTGGEEVRVQLFVLVLPPHTHSHTLCAICYPCLCVFKAQRSTMILNSPAYFTTGFSINT